MSIGPRVSFSLLVVLLSACGPASPTVDVRLQTGFESQGHFKNLMNGLSRPTAMISLSGLHCQQPNLFAGLDLSPGGGDDELLETFPVNLEANYLASGNFAIDALWMKNNTEISPITIPVPRGVEVGVGLIGSVIATGAADSVGRCQDFNPLTFSTYDTYTLSGHRRVVANSTMDVPLNVFISKADATPSATPGAASAPDSRCTDESTDDQFCPTTNYYAVTCFGADCPSLQFKLEYAYGRNRSEHIAQWLDGMPVASTFSIPDILPIRVTAYNHHTTSPELNSVVIRKSDFSSGTPQIAVIPALTANAKITILERARKPPSPLGQFSVSLAYDPFGNGILNWQTPLNAQAGITTYEVRRASNAQTSGTASNYPTAVISGLTSNSYVLSSGFTPGAIYYLRVYANDGSTTSYSNTEVTFAPIATPIFNTLTPVSNIANAAWSPPPGSQCSGNYLQVFVANTRSQIGSDIATSGTGNCTASFTRPVGDTPGTYYDFQIYSTNPSGGKAFSTVNQIQL